MTVELTGILDAIIVGLASGTIYGVMALGFVILYRVARIINIAVGDMCLIGAYLILSFAEMMLIPNLALNLVLAIVLAGIFSIILAVMTERGLFKPLYGQPILTLIMMTVALGLVVRGTATAVWGTTLRVFPGQHEIWPPKPLQIGVVGMPYPYLWSIPIAIAVLAVFFYVFRRTIFGFAMRAVSLDPEAAVAHGISITKMYSYSWIIAYIAAVLGGLVLGALNGINVMISDIGLSRALPVALIGGLDSPGGAIVAGLLMGLIEHTLGTYLNMILPGIREVVPFIVLLGVLIIKPYGLFGTVRIERV